MSAEQHAACEEARQRIRRVHENGAGELDLVDLALTHLPEELGELTTLTTLRADGCFKLRDISSLRCCKRLAVLDLRACPHVIDLSPLRGLHTLRELYLGTRDREAVYKGKEPPSELSDIAPLTDLTALESLSLQGCARLSYCQPLANLSALQTLSLSGCEELQDLRPLAGLNALQRLDLSGCGQLQVLPSLAGLSALQTLYLRGCKQLQDLPPLAALARLKVVKLQDTASGEYSCG